MYTWRYNGALASCTLYANQPRRAFLLRLTFTEMTKRWHCKPITHQAKMVLKKIKRSRLEVLTVHYFFEAKIFTVCMRSAIKEKFVDQQIAPVQSRLTC